LPGDPLFFGFLGEIMGGAPAETRGEKKGPPHGERGWAPMAGPGGFPGAGGLGGGVGILRHWGFPFKGGGGGPVGEPRGCEKGGGGAVFGGGKTGNPPKPGIRPEFLFAPRGKTPILFPFGGPGGRLDFYFNFFPVGGGCFFFFSKAANRGPRPILVFHRGPPQKIFQKNPPPRGGAGKNFFFRGPGGGGGGPVPGGKTPTLFNFEKKFFVFGAKKKEPPPFEKTPLGWGKTPPGETI